MLFSVRRTWFFLDRCTCFIHTHQIKIKWKFISFGLKQPNRRIPSLSIQRIIQNSSYFWIIQIRNLLLWRSFFWIWWLFFSWRWLCHWGCTVTLLFFVSAWHFGHWGHTFLNRFSVNSGFSLFHDCVSFRHSWVSLILWTSKLTDCLLLFYCFLLCRNCFLLNLVDKHKEIFFSFSDILSFYDLRSSVYFKSYVVLIILGIRVCYCTEYNRIMHSVLHYFLLFNQIDLIVKQHIYRNFTLSELYPF